MSDVEIYKRRLERERAARKQAEAIAEEKTRQLYDANQSLEAARDLALQASLTKSQFLANMSHEIRTPMNGVIGMTRLAMETELTDIQREYLQTVSLSAEALLNVINDILDFSKIEAGALDFDPVPIYLRELLDGTLKSVAMQAHRKGLELSCHLDGDVPDGIVADPVRLRQILLNLAGNAVKFTQEGEVTVRVEVISREEERVELKFSVTDTGIGIPPEKQSAIFQAFSQADSSTTRLYGGTGLGLAICTRLVNIMGGAIGVQSQPGQGSSFHFTCSFGLHAEQEPHPQQADLSGMRVLVVDDSATNRRLLEEILKMWGMLPTLAAGGEEALRAVEAAGEPFDLVLCDANMPDMDGFEMVRRFNRAVAQKPLVMMLTSSTLKGDSERCRTLGIRAHLTKPINQSELLNTILKAVGLQKVSARSAPSPAPGPARHTPLAVLLAEDNEVNRRLATMLLERQGHKVTCAGNGQEAVKLSEAQSFDVIFMDLQMPHMDGLEATACIRKREQEQSLPRVPIVALTAHAMKGDRERCLEGGMDNYLTKPIDPAGLVRVLDEVLPAAIAAPPTSNGVPAATSPNHVLDAEALLMRAGSLENIGILRDLFRDSYPEQLRQLDVAFESRNSSLLRDLAHAIKGNFLNFGALEAAEVAQRLDSAARACHWHSIEPDLALLRTHCRQVEQAMLALSGGRAEPIAPAETPGRTSGSVLIVDDDTANRLIARNALRGDGHTIREACDGVEALEVLARQNVDVILMDVVMPRMDGFEACRRLKSQAATRKIPVLLVTALDERRDRLSGIEAGADDFIIKPIDAHEVALRVSNAVRSKQLHDEVQENLEKLQRLEELRDGLTHMLVHDMRTPLTGISGFARLLRDSGCGPLNEAQQRYVERIGSLSTVLVEMVTTILDTSRLEADELPLEKVEVDLAALINEETQTLMGLANATLVVDAPITLKIACDPTLMRRVLTNLLSNALKYSPDGESVVVRLTRRGLMARVEVNDRGPGVPTEMRFKIFEKFAQVESGSQRHAYSSGLCLTFCKLVVEKHEGRIGVEPQPGGGSTFWFELPGLAINPDEVVARDNLLALVEGNLENLRVLVEYARAAQPPQWERIEAALANERLPEVLPAVMTLRGNVATFGARLVEPLLEQLSQLSLRGDLAGARRVASQLKLELERLDQALEALL